MKRAWWVMLGLVAAAVVGGAWGQARDGQDGTRLDVSQMGTAGLIDRAQSGTHPCPSLWEGFRMETAGLSFGAQNETHPNPSLGEGLQESPRVVGVPGGGPKFVAFDVIVDAGAEGLAAYQVEIKDAAGFAKIVGIEGGEGLYNAAPYYDPAAMQKEHVIIGALSTSAADGLPRGATRVARVHVMVEGGEPRWEAVVMTAGASGGKKVEATVKVRGAE